MGIFAPLTGQFSEIRYRDQLPEPRMRNRRIAWLVDYPVLPSNLTKLVTLYEAIVDSHSVTYAQACAR